MANMLLRRALLDAVRVPANTRCISELAKIGSREWVGPGYNGQPNYADRPDFPLPAVRFMPDTPDIKNIKSAPPEADELNNEKKILAIEVKSSVYNSSINEPFFLLTTILRQKRLEVLREKEKGDWRKLTKEEKKALYRASFCQTFAEFQAPTGEWKGALGWALAVCSLSVWIYMGMKLFVYGPLPESLSEENQKAQLKRMLDLHVNPIDGLSSKWDYENNRWK